MTKPPNLIKNDFKMFQTKEFVYLLQWLRNYNDQLANGADKIQIAGIDKQFNPKIMLDCIKKINFDNTAGQDQFIKLMRKMDKALRSVLNI